ncbi:hypothetical protein AGLY_001386 [Aphis glycines]|uniref:Uncharacterized protein n=1 Tax=Aphis glycines TaxID=307491 RepID=A0A6G0U5H9_APHGL|nr:hypothetical protein AGLY_001386 [Aphis glycines]
MLIENDKINKSFSQIIIRYIYFFNAVSPKFINFFICLSYDITFKSFNVSLSFSILDSAFLKLFLVIPSSIVTLSLKTKSASRSLTLYSAPSNSFFNDSQRLFRRLFSTSILASSRFVLVNSNWLFSNPVRFLRSLFVLINYRWILELFVLGDWKRLTYDAQSLIPTKFVYCKKIFSTVFCSDKIDCLISGINCLFLAEFPNSRPQMSERFCERRIRNKFNSLK